MTATAILDAMPAARLTYLIRRSAPWILGALAVFGLLALYAIAVGNAPQWFNPELRTPAVGPSGAPPPPLTRGERLTAAHNARFLAVSIAGALVVLTGLVYTGVNYRLAHRGQATERFTKALERLDSDELYVRIGGIHALQRLLRDSTALHADIVDVLVAFIREKVPRARDADDVDNPIWPRVSLAKEPAADVQAALTALAARPPGREHGPLNLAHLHLQGAQLRHARLQGANLSKAQLRDANLIGAQLQDANLYFTELQRAALSQAQLQGAELLAASLQGANLYMAHLQGANLYLAALQGANLRGAQLQDATLSRARLQGSSLRGAQLQGANLSEAQVHGANLFEAQLHGANLRGAQLQGAACSEDQVIAAATDGDTIWPDGTSWAPDETD